jgi:hypothetical protein
MYQSPTALAIRREIAVFMILGYILTFLATLALYAWYAASEQESYNVRRGIIPMVSDMFGDWPILSSATMGIGIGLLHVSVLLVATTLQELDKAMLQNVKFLVILCMAVQASLWILISTGTKNGETSIHVTVVHATAAFLFTSSCTWALYEANSLCKRFHRRTRYLVNKITWNAKVLSVVPFLCFLCLTAIAMSLLLMIIQIIAGYSSDMKKMYVWPILACSELFITTLSGIGYGILMYAYYSMQYEHVPEHVPSAVLVTNNASKKDWVMNPPHKDP